MKINKDVDISEQIYNHNISRHLFKKFIRNNICREILKKYIEPTHSII